MSSAKQIPLYQVDSFTSELFGGNPAAVCLPDDELPTALMQKIAAENNLAETAFVNKTPRGLHIRWFTPEVEVDLCGHATLAAAYVCFRFLGHRDKVVFDSLSGPLPVTVDGERLTLDFPGRNVEPCPATPELLAAFPDARAVYSSGKDTYLVELRDEEAVRAYRPDFPKLAKIDRCVNITAQGRECDFVSRFFGPNIGLPEDPVTGSAHCGLAIHWARKLNKKDEELHARQLSARGGELFCRLVGERVKISGQVALYLTGQIQVPG